MADKESVLLRTKKQELDLLNKVISYNCNQLDEMEEQEVSKRGRGEVDDDEGGVAGGVKRKVTSLNTLSAGTSGTVYTEFAA